MVKFRGSKSECVKGNQIATVYRIEQNCRGVIRISGELGISGPRAPRYSDNEIDKPRSGLIVKGETCIDEFCPPERFEVLCSLIASCLQGSAHGAHLVKHLTARVLRTHGLLVGSLHFRAGGRFPRELRRIPHLHRLQDTSDMLYANVGNPGGTMQMDFPCDWGLSMWAFRGPSKYGLEGCQ